ncbi:phosphotransferase [Methylorubrum populi]
MSHDLRSTLAAAIAEEYQLSGALRSVVKGHNHTFALDNEHGALAYVRMYREEGRTAEQISAELNMLGALIETTNFHCSKPFKTTDGRNFTSINISGFQARYFAVFEAINGRMIENCEGEYRQLGRAIRDLHTQSPLPGYIENRVFEEADFDKIYEYAQRNLQELSQESLRIVDRLKNYNIDAEAFGCGIRHGDVNPNNLILSENKLYMIDFDECDYGCQAFDLASIAFWLEHTSSNQAKMLFKALMSGYGMEVTDEVTASLNMFLVHKQILTLRFLKKYCTMPSEIWTDMVRRADLFLSNVVQGRLNVFA